MDEGFEEMYPVISMVGKVMGLVRVEWSLLNVDFYTFSSTVIFAKGS